MACFPRSFEVIAKLDDDPGYVGSVHHNETARSLGYRAALIPGAFVYGYATRLAVQAWGMDWIERGAIRVRFRRPVYDGDRLTVEAGALTETEDGDFAELAIMNAEGERVLVGTARLPHENPAVATKLVFLPHETPRPELGVGDVVVGMRFGTAHRVLTDKDVRISREALGEIEPIYRQQNVVHSGCLVRLTMRDTLQSYKLPIPPIFTAVETRNYAPVRPGSRMSTSARVTDVFERNGKHYFVSEEFLVADGGTVVARHDRVNLYAM